MKEKKVLVILKNPSTAKVNHDEEIYESDPTVNSLSKYFYRKKFTEIIIVNLFVWCCKDSKDLNKYAKTPEVIIGANNDQYIKKYIEEVKIDRKNNKDSRIVVAWGGFPDAAKKEMIALYNERIKKVEGFLPEQGVYYVN